MTKIVKLIKEALRIFLLIQKLKMTTLETDSVNVIKYC